jgi:hypothetical protein
MTESSTCRSTTSGNLPPLPLAGDPTRDDQRREGVNELADERRNCGRTKRQ